MCIIRASGRPAKHFRQEHTVAFALLECSSRSGTSGLENVDFHIMDMDFFDEQNVIIVYQSYAEEGGDFFLSFASPSRLSH